MSISPASSVSENSVLPLFVVDGRPGWIEKYRAALVEMDPNRQLRRIDEAQLLIRNYESLQVGGFEQQALEDARQVLDILRQQGLGRASCAPWL